MTLSPGSVFVLCIRDNGFTLTNGFASHCEDHCSEAQIHKSLIHILLSLDVGQVVCTDESPTYSTLLQIISKLTEYNPLRHMSKCILSHFDYKIGTCHECEKECHRYRAVLGTSKFLKFGVKMIPHCTVSTPPPPPPPESPS